ncbi:RadC family protein [Candidatus Contubernalis alkaliaceticus]|uniref:RadC family protein n=1 Tax=Candidatus Contubernalis alkaliaceticus TaxID=338645 RepID=UPI001F4BDAFA|nr:DNA repair protein RadC [Candidatus Contubernalis alkalaceticus]UNC90918.1 DNA repair protein RadC [Candidatus Contubernalis alkalaceticus]
MKFKKDHVTIKELPEEERPREKMIRFGAERVSNAELLAIIIRTGSRRESAIALAEKILSKAESLRELPLLTIEELMELNGVGLAKGVQIKAALELGRRMASSIKQEDKNVSSPKDVADYLMEEMRYYQKEYFKVILLNTKNQIISTELISIGSLNSSIVHPREIFSVAIKKVSASVILVHNHPSGDPTPSREDIEVTKRIIQAGDIIGITVLDHMIIGEGRYYSFREGGLI